MIFRMKDVLDYIDEMDYINAVSVLVTTSLTFTIGLLWRDTCKHWLNSYVIVDENIINNDDIEKNKKLFFYSFKTNIVGTVCVLIVVSLIHAISKTLSSFSKK